MMPNSQNRNYWRIRAGGYGNVIADKFFDGSYMGVNFSVADDIEVKGGPFESALRPVELELKHYFQGIREVDYASFTKGVADILKRYCNNTPDKYADKFWEFLFEIRIGDIVLCPKKDRTKSSYVGRVIGNYEYSFEGCPHCREVEWFGIDKESSFVPEEIMSSDLRGSVGDRKTLIPLSQYKAEIKNLVCEKFKVEI